MTPIRLRLSRTKGFNLQAHSKSINGLPAVNVARPGPWGNPFIVGKHGDREYCVKLCHYLLTGHLCISISNTDDQKTFMQHALKHLPELKGMNLACWCRLDGKPCHADLLLEAANQ